MLKTDASKKTMNLLIAVSAIYAIIELNIVFFAPIATIVIPYRFMKSKEGNREKNSKVLNHLFIFNILMFLAVMAVTNHVNYTLLNIVSNIVLALIYYKLTYSLDTKRNVLYKDPKLLYNELTKRVLILERVYSNTEEEMRNATNEKSKEALQTKLDILNTKIDEIKVHINILDQQIKNSNFKNDDNNDKLN